MRPALTLPCRSSKGGIIALQDRPTARKLQMKESITSTNRRAIGPRVSNSSLRSASNDPNDGVIAAWLQSTKGLQSSQMEKRNASNALRATCGSGCASSKASLRSFKASSCSRAFGCSAVGNDDDVREHTVYNAFSLWSPWLWPQYRLIDTFSAFQAPLYSPNQTLSGPSCTVQGSIKVT